MWDKILLITSLVLCWTALIIREIIQARKAAPNGKVFVDNFYDKVKDILRAQIDDNLSHVAVFMPNGFTFNVKVVEDFKQKGLKYETIPMYKCYTVYIDDEPVCRAHNLTVCASNKKCIEFSSKRCHTEVIDIVEHAYSIAKERLNERCAAWFSKYNSVSFYPSTKD